MPAAALRRHSYTEYLDIEAATGVKHEYFDGNCVAMAGGTPVHAHLGGQVHHLLKLALAGRPCRPFNSDLKVRVVATGLATYPDASVVCGKLALHPDDSSAATNAAMIVEVLSPSTERYDRGEKWGHYQAIPELREYVLVSTDRVRVEVFRRAGGGEWTYAAHGAGESVALPSLGVSLAVDAIYEGWAELRAQALEADGTG